jgi:GT2 family glycosyltransferase
MIEAIVVAYNTKVSDSPTVQKIGGIHDPDVEVCIVDNSAYAADNRAYCQEKGLAYLSMDGNKGLSKAYNRALDHCKEADVVVLFDDDTDVDTAYFAVLKQALRENPDADIFAPVVYGQNGVVYSPNEYHFFRNRLVLNEGKAEPAQDKFNAIASGLAIRNRVFADYRFNELLFVDQIDQYFCLEQRKLGRKFVKLDLVVHQNFSQRDPALTPANGWRRLRTRLIDIMRQARLIGGVHYKLLAFVKCCGLGVQIGTFTKSAEVVAKAIGLSVKLLFVNM